MKNEEWHNFAARVPAHKDWSSNGIASNQTEQECYSNADYDTLVRVCVCLNRISGAVDALGRALVPVSRQIRENPPKERPGGPPPQLQPLLAGVPPAGYAAAPPYGAPRYR